MSAPECVLGVSGVCWVGSRNLTQLEAFKSVALGVGVLGVLGLRARARMYENFFASAGGAVKNLYARTKKPYQPYTPDTEALMPLFLLVFLCVECVLGLAVLCWVCFCEGGCSND